MTDQSKREYYERLAPEVKAFLRETAKMAAAPLSRETYLERRQFVEFMALKTAADTHGLRKVENKSIPGSVGGVPVRIYTPEGDAPLPVLLFCHGGGWVVGGLAMEEHVCLALAEKTPCIVISVDYRLAPEHPFPAALHDCYDALRWAATMAGSFGGDPERIAVSGESAGANLVAAVALMSKDRGGPKIVLQALFNPVTDLTGFHTESHREFAEGFALTRADIEVICSFYAPDLKDRSNPYVSPLLAPDLSGLPPAFIITSGCDPLRDEGEAYAERLKEAGVPVTLTRYEDMIHGFLYFVRSSESARRALADSSAALRDAFSK